jgi:hypothetical protein
MKRKYAVLVSSSYVFILSIHSIHSIHSKTLVISDSYIIHKFCVHRKEPVFSLGRPELEMNSLLFSESVEPSEARACSAYVRVGKQNNGGVSS